MKNLNSNHMKKLDAYKQAKADLEFATETRVGIVRALETLGSISVNSSITINSNSSDKQYVYAISILNNQIVASKELGMDTKEFEDSKTAVILIRNASKEYRAWDDYYHELHDYANKVRKLLSDDELFQLLEAPVKP
jgi:hypothetical protein